MTKVIEEIAVAMELCGRLNPTHEIHRHIIVRALRAYFM
jgi:hypothetical protein